MGIVRRALASLKNRGIIGSIDIALTILAEKAFDRRYGTDTLTHVRLDALSIPSKNKARGVEYQPTRIRPFKALMKALRFPAGSVFVDFGCGKGRVLLLAAHYGFARVVGVEFSPELCRIAENNIAAYKKKTGIGTDMTIVAADAVHYEIQDDDNVFYMFHPFRADVVKRVVDNICRSLTKRQREVFIIYLYPSCRDQIEKKGVFFVHGEYVLGDGRFVVYTNRKQTGAK